MSADCHRAYNVQREQIKKQELLPNTMAFISCRSRLTIMLADAARRRRKGSEITGC